MLHTVTLVEDESFFATLLKDQIDRQPTLACVAIYANAEELRKGFANTPSDIVMMDIQLPGDSGIQLTAELKQLYPNTQVIMCTSFDDDDKVFQSLKAGAGGYIVKTDTPEDVVEGILEIIQGGAPMSLGIARKVLQHFQQIESEKHALEVLTVKENELLALLAKGLFYKEIASKLNIELDTVKKHCGNIYRKLHVSNRTEATNVFNQSK